MTEKIALLTLAWCVMSLLGFVLIRIDKLAAEKGQRRIPERSILTVGFMLGSVGVALGMKMFRHKTKKPGFIAVVMLAVVLNVVVVWVVFV